MWSCRKSHQAVKPGIRSNGELPLHTPRTHLVFRMSPPKCYFLPHKCLTIIAAFIAPIDVPATIFKNGLSGLGTLFDHSGWPRNPGTERRIGVSSRRAARKALMPTTSRRWCRLVAQCGHLRGVGGELFIKTPDVGDEVLGQLHPNPVRDIDTRSRSVVRHLSTARTGVCASPRRPIALPGPPVRSCRQRRCVLPEHLCAWTRQPRWLSARPL